MIIQFKETSIPGYYNVYINQTKVGQICKYISGEVLFNGFTIEDTENILAKMKELRNEKI